MSAKHTQGRLFFAYDDNGFYEIGSDANSLRIAFTYGEGETDESNARRLVACWNACEGIPTARVEAGAVDILAYSMDIKAQRDELLTTIIAAAALAHHGSSVKALLDDAIAKKKGGAA